MNMPVDDDHGDLVLRLRDRLAKLVGLCFEQYLDDIPGFVYSEEQEEFAIAVQISAGRVSSDLRTLFPRGWANAKSELLQKLPLRDDNHLIGGFVRFLQSRSELEETDLAPKLEKNMVNELILPVARALTANWADGNRKEAAVILSQLTSSGKLTGQTVQAMARMLKKVCVDVFVLRAHIHGIVARN